MRINWWQNILIWTIAFVIGVVVLGLFDIQIHMPTFFFTLIMSIFGHLLDNITRKG